MTDFDKGFRHAKDLMWKEPDRLEYWLDRAKRGKRRLFTRLFNHRKYRFLAGLLAGLEAHKKSQQSANKSSGMKV